MDVNSRFFKVKRLCDLKGVQKTNIVPVNYIQQSTHLFPKFGAVVPAEWTSANVLDQVDTFYVNPFTD